MDEIYKTNLEKNLERYEFFSKNNARLIRSVNPSRISFFSNENGDLNLKIQENSHIAYAYSTSDIEKEVSNWFSSLSLKGTKILYVYGIGLGYYYRTVKEWLHEDPSRFLIFLEDDKEIIYHFFQTDLATEILHNKQVRLEYLDPAIPYEGSPIDVLTTAFLFDPYKFSCLDYYKTRQDTLSSINQSLSHSIYSKKGRMGEFLSGSAGFYTNYYENLNFLQDSYLANSLFDKFHNVPAIICGAGPSLEKNIHLLKTLGNRALIIAGGSAINALNSYDISPHFAAGIDPNPTQLTRILANNEYETPFFYRNRIYSGALSLQSGPKLYVTGAGGYKIPEYFETKLGIEKQDPIDEGYNVINFSVSIAKKLGCNPIILCGVDLAYTNNQSYLQGMKFHALHNFKKTFITKGPQDELVGFKDINGNSTTTLWKWINEASWFSEFVEKNPKTLMLNATEGGIGFPLVKSITLKDVADKYLQKSYDFESLIHGEIQNSQFPEEVNSVNVLKIMKLLRKSLGQCEIAIKELVEKCSGLVKLRLSDKLILVEPTAKEIAKMQLELNDNDYYKYVLSQFRDNYIWLFEKRMPYFLYDLEEGLKDSKIMSRIELELDCFHFLQKTMRENKQILERAIKKFHSEKRRKKQLPKKNISVTSNKMTLKDFEEIITHYPNHAIKSVQHLKDNLLDGLSVFYAKNGQVLSNAWYHKGLLDGQSIFYYMAGKIFGVKNFKAGLKDGLQEFYYPDGSKKTTISYKNGRLDGAVYLYYPNHLLKRELHFKDGKRDGVEKMWNIDGLLIIEAHYENDKPCEEANWWYDDGKLKQKTIYHEALGDYEIHCYTPDGKEISKEVVEEQDYFDRLIKMTNAFMKSISEIFAKTEIVLPLLEGGDRNEILEAKASLKLLRQEIDKLITINETIRQNFSGNAHQLEEPIWKSHALQSKIEEQLGGLIEMMKQDVQAVQNLIQKAIDKVMEQSK
jgi:antitoxin component YwqK of YwqJK toxin-antitoxin module